MRLLKSLVRRAQELVREMVEADCTLLQQSTLAYDKRASQSLHERCQSEGELSVAPEPTFVVGSLPTAEN